MIYEWEASVKKQAMRRMMAQMPDGYRLVGIAVEHLDNVEAALILSDDQPEAGMEAADVMQDILGDAQNNYQGAYENTFGSGWTETEGKQTKTI